MRIERCCACVLVLLLSLIAFAAEPPAENRWQKTIENFLELDRQQPPEGGQVLFVGSSSIRMWDLKKHFPDLDALNRGFGGSQMADVLRYVDQIVIPYRPRAIVLYEGDNDIAAGKTPDLVLNDYQKLVEQIHEALGETPVYFLTIKPSVARWALYDRMLATNRQIDAFNNEHDWLHTIDVSKVMLNDDGMPRADLFIDDGLHLNDRGYQLWSKLVRDRLPAKGRDASAQSDR